MSKPLHITSRTDWTPSLIEQTYLECEKIAHEELGLKGLLYPNQIEIISAEQMLDAYASVGMPVSYNHWSFGKEFLKNEKAYQSGRMGLAYEIVINADPCISYLMEENSMLMQAMVIAHAAIGHNAVFRNNETFKQWTSAGSIIDYMIFARDYIRQCEHRYGVDEVEAVLDAAHALAPHGVDKFKRKHRPKLNDEQRLKLMMQREEQKQKDLDIILKKTSFKDPELDGDHDEYMEEEENLLYFIMKQSPTLPQWKREILRIVYKVNQYFYPQAQCVTGENLVATGRGLLRLDELITTDGYMPVDGLQLITEGDRLTPVSHTYRKMARVLRIKTHTGREYVGTPEHPLQAVSGMVKLGDLKLGDHLVLNTDYQNVFATEPVKLEPIHPTEVARSAGKSVNMPTIFPEVITPEMGAFIACLQHMTIADTNVFTMARAPQFNGLVKRLFGLELTDDAFSSWGLRTFIKQLDLRGVPLQIRTSPRDVVISYLRTLFDIGAVRRSTISTFEYVGEDETLAHLQVLLNALGIIATVKVADESTLMERRALMIISTFRRKFEQVIGSDLPLPAYNGNPRVSTKDLIPGAMALLEQVRQHVASRKQKVLEDTQELFYSEKLRTRQRLKDHGSVFVLELPEVRSDEISRIDVERDMMRFEYACSIDCDASRSLRALLAKAAVSFYDRVVSIEELEEERVVYDVTVPENHLFWMSGLISHNTKNLNEGYASFCHYYIMTRLEEKGYLSPDAFMAFLDHHAGVIFQPTYNKRYYSGINPYALGFAVLQDVKRICENPTQEDKEWFPYLRGRRWQDAVQEAVFEHRDDSFICQYLSPKVMRDMRMFSVNLKHSPDEGAEAFVSEIHDDIGYRNIRTHLARSFERINYVPQIKVAGADMEGDRTLHLRYEPYNGRTLDIEDANTVTDYVDYLWCYPVELDIPDAPQP